MYATKREKKHICMRCFREIPQEFIYCEECLEKEKKSSANIATVLFIIFCIILSFMLYVFAAKYEINYIIVCFPIALLSLLKLIRNKVKDIVEAGNHRKVTQPVSKPTVSEPVETSESDDSIPPLPILLMDLPFELSLLWNNFFEMLYKYIVKYADKSVMEILLDDAQDNLIEMKNYDSKAVLSFTAKKADHLAIRTLLYMCMDALSSGSLHDYDEHLSEDGLHIYDFALKCNELLLKKEYITKSEYMSNKKELSDKTILHY